MSDKVTIFGRLGKNPELKYTAKQEAVCNFTLAENIEGQEAPVWHRIVVWGRLAEQCNLYLKKGVPTFVQGLRKVRAYDDKNGDLQTIEEVKAFSIGFTDV